MNSPLRALEQCSGRHTGKASLKPGAGSASKAGYSLRLSGRCLNLPLTPFHIIFQKTRSAVPRCDSQQ